MDDARNVELKERSVEDIFYFFNGGGEGGEIHFKDNSVFHGLIIRYSVGRVKGISEITLGLELWSLT